MISEILVTSPSSLPMPLSEYCLPLFSHFTGHRYDTRSSSLLLYTLQVIPHYVASGTLWIAVLLQWAFRRIELRSADYYQETGVQLHITCTFVLLYAIRHYPCIVSDLRRKLARANGSSPFLQLDPYTISPSSVHNYILFTTLVTHFFLPQSTSIFTNSCRPFTSPFPQCQDLLHAPPTYVMTAWIAVLLIRLTSMVLDWFEIGMPISFEWHHFCRFSLNLRIRSIPFCLFRLSVLFFCCQIAFDEPEAPYPPHFASKPVLSTPAAFLARKVVIILTGCLLYILAAVVQYGVSKLDIPSHFRRVALRASDSFTSSQSYCERDTSLPGLALASPATQYLPSPPRTPARNMTNAKRCHSYKRSPLTPMTFEPPHETAESHSLHFRTQPACSIYVVPDAVNPATQLEWAAIGITDMGYTGARASNLFYDDTCAVSDLGEQKDRPLEFTLMAPYLRDESSESDTSEEDCISLARPGSRLGFNDEENSPRRKNSYDGDWELASAATDLLRPAPHRAQGTWTSSDDSALYSLETSLTPVSSPDSSPSNSCPEISHSASLETSDTACTSDEDRGEYPISPARASYDWAKAAIFLGLKIGKEFKEAKRGRLFHLARIPSLYTIDEVAEAIGDGADSEAVR